MRYRQASELMLYAPNKSKYIHQNQKKGIWAELNTYITNEMRKGKYKIHFKNPENHFITELLTYGPLYLNFLVQRGYKKILFVNHFNIAQKKWLLSGKNDRIFHGLPEGMLNVADPNVLFQFLPVIAKLYGYDLVIDAVLPTGPTNNRHRFLLQETYDKFGVDWVESDHQYKHNGRRVEVDVATDGSKYDAVVFAGVPNFAPELKFTAEAIIGQWAKYGHADYEIVDLWGNEPSDIRFADSAKEDIVADLSVILMNRQAWDPTPQDMTYAAELLADSINVFKKPPPPPES